MSQDETLKNLKDKNFMNYLNFCKYNHYKTSSSISLQKYFEFKNLVKAVLWKMKFIEVTMIEISASELYQVEDKTPVLVFDTLKQTYKIVKNNDSAIYHSPIFNDKRYVLLLFTQPIFKNFGGSKK